MQIFLARYAFKIRLKSRWDTQANRVRTSVDVCVCGSIYASVLVCVCSQARMRTKLRWLSQPNSRRRRHNFWRPSPLQTLFLLSLALPSALPFSLPLPASPLLVLPARLAGFTCQSAVLSLSCRLDICLLRFALPSLFFFFLLSFSFLYFVSFQFCVFYLSQRIICLVYSFEHVACFVLRFASVWVCFVGDAVGFPCGRRVDPSVYQRQRPWIAISVLQ